MREYLKHSVAINKHYTKLYYLNEAEWTEDEDNVTEDPEGLIHLLHQSYLEYTGHSSYRCINIWTVPHALAVL